MEIDFSRKFYDETINCFFILFLRISINFLYNQCPLIRFLEAETINVDINPIIHFPKNFFYSHLGV